MNAAAPTNALLVTSDLPLFDAITPAQVVPAMDTLLADKGLMSRLTGQLQQARENMGEKASQLVVNAMGFLGVPYKYGGNGIESGGFDCSGFVRHLYETSVGRLLPRRAEEQAVATDKIDRSELNPGDLVFFNTMRRTFSHVGIYLGDGKFIHAPSAGKAVRVDDLRAAYWTKRFTGARRVQDTTTPDSTSR